jgi:hypothetical protein
VKEWWIRALLVVTALGLIATSPPATYSDSYETSVAAPRAVVTLAAPRARFEVRIRAGDLLEATGGAVAAVRGSVVEPSADSSFVRVTIDDGWPTSSTEFLTSFSRAAQPVFTGDCRELDPSSPCEGSFVVTFERSGEAGGDAPTEIEWNIDLRARVSKDDPPDRGPLPLPWQVEVTPLE